MMMVPSSVRTFIRFLYSLSLRFTCTLFTTGQTDLFVLLFISTLLETGCRMVSRKGRVSERKKELDRR